MNRQAKEVNRRGRGPRNRWRAWLFSAGYPVLIGLSLLFFVGVGTTSASSPAPAGPGNDDSVEAQPSGSDQSTGDGSGAAPSPAAETAADNPADTPSGAEPAEAASPPPPDTESFWHFKWLGWDGIDFEVQERTSFTNPTIDADSETLHALSQFSVERMTFHARIGVRMDVDVAAFANSGDAPDPGLRMELRRFRILTKGDLQFLFPLIYQLELGYVPNEFYVENMYLAMDGVSYLGQLKFGAYAAPMGFENMMSSRWITFMEAASATQALTPGTNVGLQMSRTYKDDRISLQAGLFGGGLTTDSGDASQNYGRLIGRTTYLLKIDEGDDPDRPVALTHVGGSISHIYSGSGEIHYRARPESHLADYAIDTGVMDGSSATALGAEFVRLNGPHLIQGEFFYSAVDLSDGPSLSFFGGYVSSSWILTGERRRYSRDLGIFGGVTPTERFSFKHWRKTSYELSLRASYTDLSDKSIDGGRMLLGTVGFTAYLRDRVRFKLNLVGGQARTETNTSNYLLLETRISIDLGP